MNFLKGDITKATDGILINGVNCQRVMGSGVARAYFEKWPVVREQYMVWEKSEQKLGKVDYVIIEHDKLYVANCWTQEFFGGNGKVYADYTAILATVSQAALFARERDLVIRTPLVGAGLGGLDRDKVIKVLEYVEAQSGVPIYLYELEQVKNR